MCGVCSVMQCYDTSPATTQGLVHKLFYKNFDPIYKHILCTCTFFVRACTCNTGVIHCTNIARVLKYVPKCMFSVPVVPILACVWRFNFLREYCPKAIEQHHVNVSESDICVK